MAEDNWIELKGGADDVLPEVCVDVLVSYDRDDDSVDIAFLDTFGRFVLSGMDGVPVNVIAWQPLPAAFRKQAS